MLTAIAGLVLLLIGFFSGVPLGVVLLTVGYFGFAFVHPNGFAAATAMAGQQIVGLATDFQFSVLPLFVLMGTFVNRAALSDDLYEVAYRWLGHYRGGLALATIAACAGFAAICGSSLATAATMARVAVPSMRRYDYADWLSTGTVAAGGALGMLVPPSGALIVYGLLTQEDIAKLFLAAIVPALLSVAVYFCVVQVVTLIKPAAGPRAPKAPWGVRMRALAQVWGVLVLFALIMGGITFGVFTATEAGGIGASGALILAILRGKMSWPIFYGSLVEAATTTAMIFTVIFGALVLTQFVNISGLSEAVLDFIRHLDASPIEIVLCIMAFYVLLGIFIEGFGLIFLTVPIFVPIVQALGFDLVWWGVALVIVVEMSVLHPPLGLNIYVLKSILPEVPLKQIFLGVIPFFLSDFVRLALVIAFPAAVLYLPRLMLR
ncbi:MAG TPA: TRAP transporter large permease subunit [Stellaceae bacterium]|nr:TRAP transporter large permease subunit [Stellaceae bacterium]